VITVNGRQRQIGGIGTAARVVLGLVFLVLGVTAAHISVIHGQVTSGVDPRSAAIGLVGFPAVVLASQWFRARIAPTRLQATGPLSTALNMLVLLALLLTPLYGRPISFTSDSALVFYGASMLLAALRGYSGCEVTAISNWILGRDDQVGCLVLGPVDELERRLRGSSTVGSSIAIPTKSSDRGRDRD
jgi:hypothetical protein